MQPKDLRVLVIEDESDSALVIGTAIEYSGAQTWTANSGEMGLELLQEVTPNLLIVDLALPGIDGWTFLDTVRANPSTANIPAVVVSAYLTPRVAEKALLAGFAAAIPKPIDTTSLVRQLISILN